jgi:histidinol-phosphatase
VPWRADLEYALSLADDADELALHRYRALDLVVETKTDFTPVTEADRAIEQKLRARIAEERGDAVAGEEFGIDEGDPRWWLDPIDGTKQYARGLPVWATLIALEQAGATVVAVVSAPALGHRWWATREGGAFCDGQPLSVSTVDRIEDSYVSTTSLRGDGFARFAPIAERAFVARTYTDFWQHVLVAEGRIEAGFEPQLNEWDWKAPKLVVEEAGGRFTTEPGCYLSSNAVLHEELRTSLLPT